MRTKLLKQLRERAEQYVFIRRNSDTFEIVEITKGYDNLFSEIVHSTIKINHSNLTTALEEAKTICDKARKDFVYNTILSMKYPYELDY